MLIAAVLLLSPGCVKQPDWIETTLVTVDVTGVWEGTVPVGDPGAVPLRTGHIRLLFDLEQEGPKVKGSFRHRLPETLVPSKGVSAATSSTSGS